MPGESAVASSVPSFKKRQDDAKKKQSGEMAPDLDQDGKMINPHNPDFITKVPWYLGSSGPTLKHHNIQKSDHFLSLSEADQLIYQKLEAQRTALETQSQKIFKKGSCKNCGATTHKEKDCVERPRSTKKSAWKSGLDIAPDEIVLKLEEYGKVSFSAKRDQWKGNNHHLNMLILIISFKSFIIILCSRTRRFLSVLCYQLLSYYCKHVHIII